MRHIQNNVMRDQLQQTLLAQAVADAAKLRHADRARAQAAEASVKFQDQIEGKRVRKVPEKTEDGKGGSKENRHGSREEGGDRDGTSEETVDPKAGSGPSSAHRIDVKA